MPIRQYREPVNAVKWVFVAIIAIWVIIIVSLISRSIHVIRPEEQGIILRLGAFNRTADPGLCFTMPFVEELYRLPVKRQLKEEFGFRTIKTRTIKTPNTYNPDELPKESRMITGDLNAADVEWVTQYRISDPRKFLFKVRNPEKAFRDLNEAVMREAVGDRTVTEIITIGRVEIEIEAKRKLQELANTYELGIVVDQIILQDVNPPAAVKDAFQEVNRAEQEKDQKINVAQQGYNQIVPQTRGKALSVILVAKGEATNIVNTALGKTARFNSVFAEYRRNPEITTERIYLETMAAVLTNSGAKTIVDSNLKGTLPLLPLTHEK